MLDQSVGARADSVVNLISVNVPLNFIPEMDPVKLAEGYRRVITTLYDPTLENYFKRCLTLLAHLKAVPHLLKPQSRNALFGAMMAIRRRLSPRQVPAYQQFMARVAKDHPRMLPEATSLAVQGYHFEKITRQQISIQDFKDFLAAELEKFKEAVSHPLQDMETIRDRRQAIVHAHVHARYESIPGDFRHEEDGIEHAMASFRFAVNECPEQFTHLAAM